MYQIKVKILLKNALKLMLMKELIYGMQRIINFLKKNEKDIMIYIVFI
jgi:hypothetical protein